MTPDAAHHFFILAVLVLAAVLVIVAMRTFAPRRGRRPASIQADGAAALEAFRGDIGEIKSRLAAVETLLREV